MARSILAHAREKLAPWQRVRRIEFYELPKTISGKIRRVELRGRENDLDATGARPARERVARRPVPRAQGLTAEADRSGACEVRRRRSGTAAGSPAASGNARTVVSSMRLQIRLAGSGWSWPGCCTVDAAGR